MENEELSLKLESTRKWLWLLFFGALIIELFFIFGAFEEAYKLIRGEVVQGRVRSLVIMLCCCAFMAVYLFKLAYTAKFINAVNLSNPSIVAIKVSDLWRYQAIVSAAVSALVVVAVVTPAY